MLRQKILNLSSFTLTFRSFSSKVSNKLKASQREKVAKVAVIGLPNVGKSTFINALVHRRVCATSDKVHTTTTFTKAIMNRDSSQIIAFDTPGLVTNSEIKKHHLGPDFISACRHSIQNSDIVGVLQDAGNHWTRNEIHPIIIDLLKEYKSKPSFLIINKIDKIKTKRVLLDVVRNLTCDNIGLKPIDPEEEVNKKEKEKNEILKRETEEEEVEIPVYERKRKSKKGWPNFQAVFMVSSVTGDGLEQVLDYIESQGKEKDWEFRNNEITDQKPTKLIEEFVRARLLDYLPQEIPYLLTTELEYYSDENNKIFACVIVKCPSARIERLVCGMSDGKLRQITDRITSDLIQHHKRPVTLTINTVVTSKNQHV